MQIRQVLVVGLSTFISAGTGCGGGQVSAETPKVEVPPPSPAPEPDVLPKGHVWRFQLMEVMSPGMGAFLQRVDVKEQMVGGQFHGFRLLDLRGDPKFWEGSGLRVGDVITSVNGGPIGHYDEAFRVWQSLITAPEVVIAYERRGEPKQLRIVVHEDDESPAAIRDALKAGKHSTAATERPADAGLEASAEKPTAK